MLKHFDSLSSPAFKGLYVVGGAVYLLMLEQIFASEAGSAQHTPEGMINAYDTQTAKLAADGAISLEDPNTEWNAGLTDDADKYDRDNFQRLFRIGLRSVLHEDAPDATLDILEVKGGFVNEEGEVYRIWRLTNGDFKLQHIPPGISHPDYPHLDRHGFVVTDAAVPPPKTT